MILKLLVFPNMVLFLKLVMGFLSISLMLITMVQMNLAIQLQMWMVIQTQP